MRGSVGVDVSGGLGGEKDGERDHHGEWCEAERGVHAHGGDNEDRDRDRGIIPTAEYRMRMGRVLPEVPRWCESMRESRSVVVDHVLIPFEDVFTSDEHA